MLSVRNFLSSGDSVQQISGDSFESLLFLLYKYIMKWTKEQLIEASLSVVKQKSQLAMIEKKVKDKGIRMTFSERMYFKKKYLPLKKKITDMENEFLLNVAGNGIEGEENAEPPPTNKEQQTFKIII